MQPKQLPKQIQKKPTNQHKEMQQWPNSREKVAVTELLSQLKQRKQLQKFLNQKVSNDIS